MTLLGHAPQPSIAGKFVGKVYGLAHTLSHMESFRKYLWTFGNVNNNINNINSRLRSSRQYRRSNINPMHYFKICLLIFIHPLTFLLSNSAPVIVKSIGEVEAGREEGEEEEEEVIPPPLQLQLEQISSLRAFNNHVDNEPLFDADDSSESNNFIIMDEELHAAVVTADDLFYADQYDQLPQPMSRSQPNAVARLRTQAADVGRLRFRRYSTLFSVVCVFLFFCLF
jgi:hypothetical protein